MNEDINRFISPTPSVGQPPDISWKNEADPKEFDGFYPCGVSINAGTNEYAPIIFSCDIYSCPNMLCNNKRGCQRATPAWEWYSHTWAEAMGGQVNRANCALTREQYAVLAKAGMTPKID